MSISRDHFTGPLVTARGRLGRLAAGTVSIGRGHADDTALRGAGTVCVSWHLAEALCTGITRGLDDPMRREVGGRPADPAGGRRDHPRLG